MMNGYDMNGWSWFGMASMVLFTLAIVALIFWASQRRQRDPSAREELDRQLAGGKIDTVEYRERLDALREDHATK
jgi:cbb3-type cytochrome oxidase subunit 3